MSSKVCLVDIMSYLCAALYNGLWIYFVCPRFHNEVKRGHDECSQRSKCELFEDIDKKKEILSLL